MTCLLSGGFDSAVAAHKMMKRGAHLSFVHFWGGGARPGESSVHTARELVRRLTPWQLSAKLFLVPFEPVQREIVASAPGKISHPLISAACAADCRTHRAFPAARLAWSPRATAWARSASQTPAQHGCGRSRATRMPVVPPAGRGRQARNHLGRREENRNPRYLRRALSHDCCPIFLPRNPVLHSSIEELDGS